MKKYDYMFVEEAFSVESYVLISDRYINNVTPLKYKCNNGHDGSVRFGDWRRGVRCPVCAGNSKLSIDYIARIFSKEGYTLLSTEYKNAVGKLDYICPIGHTDSMRWNDWQQKHRCKKCGNLKMSGANHWCWKGGISCEPYCQDWTEQLKEFIKNRDGNKCLNPDCWKEDNTLSVHHVDYNKKNCKPSNLITVCRSCNSRANSSREWHKSWYTAILKNRCQTGAYNGSWKNK